MQKIKKPGKICDDHLEKVNSAKERNWKNFELINFNEKIIDIVFEKFLSLC